MMKRATRMDCAQETVAICGRGSYCLPDGRRIDVTAPLRACLDGTQLYEPRDLKRLRDNLPALPAEAPAATLEVRNETTLSAVARLAAEPDAAVTALNFASAKNPGGGFLNGSQAQEESLARSSALYASLRRAPDYYERHRAQRSCLYTDAMILSPGCPIFRDDDGNLLERPHLATFITSAAPNAGAIAANAPEELARIPEVLRHRAELVLALAAAHGTRDLVLGAWGCGVFKNDPALVAGVFADHLRQGGSWIGRFRRVVFAVYDTNKVGATFAAFREALG
jgi:uncharacterized protein (TIGR02452 family)